MASSSGNRVNELEVSGNINMCTRLDEHSPTLMMRRRSELCYDSVVICVAVGYSVAISY